MFTFSDMLALVESESSFGAYVCHGRPGGSLATSDLVYLYLLDLHHPVANKRLLQRVGKIETRIEN